MTATRTRIITGIGLTILTAAALLITQPAVKAASGQYDTDECGFCSPYEKWVSFRKGWMLYHVKVICYKPVGGSGVCPPCEEPQPNDDGIVDPPYLNNFE